MRSAAASSASRSARGSSARALRAVSNGTSSACAEAGVQRSKRAVRSTSAASPRARTSSRMRAVALSTASSCAASNAMRRANASSNAGSAVESRRGSAMARRAQPLDQRRERRALELEGGGIHDETARYPHNLLDRVQAIRLQRVAGIDEVDEGIREPGERRELHGAVEADQIHVHSLRGEVLARGGDVLG